MEVAEYNTLSPTPTPLVSIKVVDPNLAAAFFDFDTSDPF